MKTLKLNTVFAIVLAISLMSCEKEDVNQEPLSIEDGVSIFEGSLDKQSEEEEIAEETGSDCSFDGLFDRKIRVGHFVGVNENPSQFGTDTQIEWRINGEVVTSRRPRFVRINDHISQAGPVEVCYNAVSKDCGTIEGCVTVDFNL